MSFFNNYVPNRNGHLAIAFTNAGEAQKVIHQQGYQDFSLLQDWYEEDPLKNHLGIIEQFGQQGSVSEVPFYQDLLNSGAQLEVNGMEGRFTYDLAIETDNRTKTVGDTSYQEYAGIDGTTFDIILNREFAPNTTLSCDALEGDTIVVSDSEPVSTIPGGGFLHKVVLGTNDPDKTYDPSLLMADIEYFDTGHGVAEYGEKLALTHMPGQSNYMTLEFQLGSPLGVENFFTAKANEVDLAWGTTASKDVMREAEQWAEKGMEVAFIKQTVPNRGTINTVGSLLQMLTIKKFNQLMSRSLIFQKGFTIQSEKGTLRYNEGLWRQMRRGFIVTYPKRMGMRRSHLMQASDYVFKVNPMMDVIERELRFKTGTELGKNFEILYQQEVNHQMNNIAPLMGYDRILPSNPVSGTLYDLKLVPVRFTSVYLPGIGQVSHMVDKTLDYSGMQDRMFKGANANGYAWTTYSGIIWDAADQQYSNNRRLPDNVTNIGGNTTANIHMVVPKGDKVWWGSENGRYSSKSARDIVASRKTMTESFFIYGTAAVWMRDPSKFVMIELEKSARKGYN